MSFELISVVLDEIEDKAESFGELIYDFLIKGESVDAEVLTSLVGFARIGAAVSGVDVVDKESLDQALKEVAVQLIDNSIEKKFVEFGKGLKEMTDSVINLLGEELNKNG